ncbi:class I SAM-dependent methyltransferase [Emticicia sp. 17c]|uniref:class I SAM-dependent methyltransferase n=1 Tax=Emticicia sp. 17c TaxID=3127704 RepID=UPI00301CD888
MQEAALKELASQLRHPHGQQASRVGTRMNRGNEQINLCTIKALCSEAHDTILEIGMGNGFFVKNVVSAAPFISYHGCDFSEEMVAEAIRINQLLIKKGKASFHLAEATQLPFVNLTFNKVFTVNTVYFWDNPSLVLTEINRVLKPHGQLLIALRPKAILKHYPFTSYGFRIFTETELCNLLSKQGFKVVNTIKHKEHPQEMNGETIAVASLIIVAEKL